MGAGGLKEEGSRREGMRVANRGRGERKKETDVRAKQVKERGSRKEREEKKEKGEERERRASLKVGK